MISLLGSLIPAAFTAFAPSTSAYSAEPVLRKSLPKDITAFVDRLELCNHYAGEEPYDEARRKELADGVDKAGCGKLDADEAKLKKKYRKNPKVLAALKSAHDAGD